MRAFRAKNHPDSHDSNSQSQFRRCLSLLFPFATDVCQKSFSSNCIFVQNRVTTFAVKADC